MHRDYKDIVDRLGKPLWWDGNCVPRYARFHPDLCDVYGSYVAYLEIACQACEERFFVAVEVDYIELQMKHFQFPSPPKPEDAIQKRIEEVESALDDEDYTDCSCWEEVGSFHFGDPPRHSSENPDSCGAGDTMNSVPIRIIEFWRKLELNVSNLEEYEKNKGWVRVPEYEFEMSKFERD